MKDQCASSSSSNSEIHSEYPPLFSSSKEREFFEQDLNYLHEMKKMDNSIRERWAAGEKEAERLQMTSVVPMAGLVQARFSILECELRTALEMWSPKKSPSNGASLHFEFSLDFLLYFSLLNSLSILIFLQISHFPYAYLPLFTNLSFSCQISPSL